MRKQTKFVAVLSAAALLAIGASMTSFAATSGWTEQDGTWVYLDKDQNRVTDSWKKSGNYWYYLDDDGYMSTDKIINDDDYTYYVDTTGRMVTNQWVERENDDYYDSSDNDAEPETVWYYFQSSGKAFKGGDSDGVSFKSINGKKYAFDGDGKMVFGWLDDKGQRLTSDDAFKEGVYYCGDSNDGARVDNAWRQLYISDNGPGYELADQENAWFYFGANGKKTYADDTATKEIDRQLKTKKINGKTYSFDPWGVMRAEWQVASNGTASEVNGYYSDIDSGARKTGWFQAVPSKALNESDYNDDTQNWYYANNDGSLIVSEIKTINGKKYAFNEHGAMMTGLYTMQLTDNKKIEKYAKIGASDKIGDDYFRVAATVDGKVDFANADTMTPAEGVGVYYFSGSSDDGSLKTGNQNVSVDGDTYQFSFKKDGSNKGDGITSKQNDNTLFVMGKKIKADSDYKYQVVDRKTGVVREMTTSNGGEQVPYADYCIVNTSGSIMSGTSYYKDSDGNYYHIIPVNGVKMIQYIDQDTKNPSHN